ncbi:MAG TPA: hypothetical protein VJ885_10835 [Thermoanaerobaculia bacterium]|nr:hypothetical protein [Thermoanaerobaculia bacterium]
MRGQRQDEEDPMREKSGSEDDPKMPSDIQAESEREETVREIAIAEQQLAEGQGLSHDLAREKILSLLDLHVRDL